MPRLTKDLVLAKASETDLSKIRSLNAWGSNLDDISLVKELPSLQLLALSNNLITTLEPLKDLKHLRQLYIRRNEISHIDELDHLKNLPLLTNLWIEENPFCDVHGPEYRINVLKKLPSLKKLDNVEVTEEERKQALGSQEKAIEEAGDGKEEEEGAKEGAQPSEDRENVREEPQSEADQSEEEAVDGAEEEVDEEAEDEIDEEFEEEAEYEVDEELLEEEAEGEVEDELEEEVKPELEEEMGEEEGEEGAAALDSLKESDSDTTIEPESARSRSSQECLTQKKSSTKNLNVLEPQSSQTQLDEPPQQESTPTATSRTTAKSTRRRKVTKRTAKASKGDGPSPMLSSLDPRCVTVKFTNPSGLEEQSKVPFLSPLAAAIDAVSHLDQVDLEIVYYALEYRRQQLEKH